MKVSVKVEGLDHLDEQLGQLTEQYRGKSLYSALNHASQPMLKQIRQTVPQTTAPYKRYMSHAQGEVTVGIKGGKYRKYRKRAARGEGKFVMQQAGLLRKAIRRQRLTKNNENPHRAAVGIGVRVTGKTGYSAFYWRMVEYGTRYQPARPFIRPAFDAHEAGAVDRFKAQLDKNIKKFSK